MPKDSLLEGAVREGLARLQSAVDHYWSKLEGQAEEQRVRGQADAGRRGSATGGKQMDGFIELLRASLEKVGVPSTAIHTRSKLELPGYFRATKRWDLLVVHDKRLITLVETKSIASSFGNNLNNRVEEAVGSATDFTAAYREGLMSNGSMPWLGYLFLLPDVTSTRKKVQTKAPHFKVMDPFSDASYKRRVEELCLGLVRQRLYNRSCMLLTKHPRGDVPDLHTAHPELAFEPFLRGLIAHCYANLRI